MPKNCFKGCIPEGYPTKHPAKSEHLNAASNLALALLAERSFAWIFVVFLRSICRKKKQDERGTNPWRMSLKFFLPLKKAQSIRKSLSWELHFVSMLSGQIRASGTQPLSLSSKEWNVSLMAYVWIRILPTYPSMFVLQKDSRCSHH